MLLQTAMVEQSHYVCVGGIEADFKRLGLHEAIKVTCFGMNINVPTIYAVLEMYYPVPGMVFTPVGELGMALHEMWGCPISL